MIEKNIYSKSGMAIIRSTTGRAVIGPAAPSPMPEVYVSPEADETQYSEAPRVFSKRRIFRALLDAGIWEQVKAYMETAGVWEDWQYATTLDEDDPLLVSAIGKLQREIGLSPDDLERILAAAALPQT